MPVHTVTWRVDDYRDIATLLPLARVHVKIHHMAKQVLRLTILRVSSGRDLTHLRDHVVSYSIGWLTAVTLWTIK